MQAGKIFSSIRIIIMYKVIYGTSNLFSLKKYDNSNLNCQSYPYPTVSAIRGAIMGSIIQVDGKEKATKLFHRIKNAIIFVQFPEKYTLNGVSLKRFSNNSYEITDNEKTDREKLLAKNFYTTMGFRQYVYVKEIIFFIDSSIPKICHYLKNINSIGESNSMVYLKKIKETNELKNILIENPTNIGLEQFDWSSKVNFNNVYFFSDKYDIRKKRKFLCSIKDMTI